MRSRRSRAWQQSELPAQIRRGEERGRILCEAIAGLRCWIRRTAARCSSSRTSASTAFAGDIARCCFGAAALVAAPGRRRGELPLRWAATGARNAPPTASRRTDPRHRGSAPGERRATAPECAPDDGRRRVAPPGSYVPCGQAQHRERLLHDCCSARLPRAVASVTDIFAAFLCRRAACEAHSGTLHRNQQQTGCAQFRRAGTREHWQRQLVRATNQPVIQAFKLYIFYSAPCPSMPTAPAERLTAHPRPHALPKAAPGHPLHPSR